MAFNQPQPFTFESLTHMYIKTTQTIKDTTSLVPNDGQGPLVQCISLKKIGNPDDAPNPNDRYRVIISDGVHFTQSMLATQLNHLILNKEITRHTILRLNKVVCNQLVDKRILILLDVTPMSTQELPRLGNPVADVNVIPENLPPSFNLEQATNAINRYFCGGPLPSFNSGNSDNNNFRQQQQQQQSAQNSGGMGGASTAANSYGGPTSNNYQSFNQQQQPLQQQQKQRGIGAGYTGSGTSSVVTFPIKSLSPYQNKWTIRVTVMNKSEIRTFTNAKGEGKLFSVTFADDSGEIRATGFGDAVTQFYDQIVEGRVYYVSRAQVKVAKKQFAGSVQNEYELTLDPKTEIVPCNEHVVPSIRYERTMLSELMNREKDTMIDVLAVVKDVGDIVNMVSKANKPLTKRDISLIDQSKFSVRTTLWGRSAETFGSDMVNQIVLVKGIRVGDFGGRTLSAMQSSSILVNPDVSDAHELRGWYDGPAGPVACPGDLMTYSMHGPVGADGSGGAAGGAMAYDRPQNYKTFSQVGEENLGLGEKPDYFTLRCATVSMVRDKNLYYPGCASGDCFKKVIQNDNGWRCEKCNKTFPSPQYRYMPSICFSDFSGQGWLSMFDELGREFFGKTANELNEMMEENEEAGKAFLKTLFFKQFNVKVQAKADSWQGDTRVRFNAMSVTPVNYAAGAHELAQLIAAYD